ncbi:hypothetical protein ABLN72_13125, partial [Mycobacterium tuberculosis]
CAVRLSIWCLTYKHPNYLHCFAFIMKRFRAFFVRRFIQERLPRQRHQPTPGPVRVNHCAGTSDHRST